MSRLDDRSEVYVALGVPVHMGHRPGGAKGSGIGEVAQPTVSSVERTKSRQTVGEVTTAGVNRV